MCFLEILFDVLAPLSFFVHFRIGLSMLTKKKLLLDFDHFLCCVFPSMGIIRVRIVVGLVSVYHTVALSQICMPGFPIVAQFVTNLKECPGGCGFNP